MNTIAMSCRHTLRTEALLGIAGRAMATANEEHMKPPMPGLAGRWAVCLGRAARRLIRIQATFHATSHHRRQRSAAALRVP